MNLIESMGVLESIEIAFRTHISYEIGHKFCFLRYKHKDNFINEKFYQDSLDELNSLTIKSWKVELFIEHHFRKYDDNLPIWVALEMTSFGFLSKFYRNLNEDLINHLAKIYFNVPYLYLDSWLQTLSNVRIVCAFYGQLYNKKLPFNPLLFREDIKTIDNLFIFAAIYITQRLLTETDLLQI